MSARPGFTLAEALVAMLVSALLASAAAALFVMQSRLTTHTIDAAESLDALRVAAALLPAEARALGETDVHAVANDSVALRAFRGAGLTCVAGANGGTVRYRGFRDPDASKDSVIIVGHVERVVALASAANANGPCPVVSGETLLDLRLSADSLSAGDVVLLFEAGAYHVSTRALRYRPPGGTRQPMTADVLAAGTGFRLARRAGPPGDALALGFLLAPQARVRSALQASAAAVDLRVHLLNAAAPPDSTAPTP